MILMMILVMAVVMLAFAGGYACGLQTARFLRLEREKTDIVKKDMLGPETVMSSVAASAAASVSEIAAFRSRASAPCDKGRRCIIIAPTSKSLHFKAECPALTQSVDGSFL